LNEDASWLAPVGRLDMASEGLLLLTDDSGWAARILAPETHLERIYHVQIDRVADVALLREIETEVRARDGESLLVKRAKLLRSGANNCWLEITLEEGRNRQIRRIFEALGIEALRLVRVAIGPFRLGELPKGASRRLSPEEKRELDRAMAAGQGHH